MSQPSTANGGFPSVVVTAVTATTSISPDIESTWKGLLAGESGIHALEDEFVTKWDLAVKIGGHLKDPVDSHMGRLRRRSGARNAKAFHDKCEPATSMEVVWLNNQKRKSNE
ncbi:beta-ketoacyl synthase N-terminal-like domain-containing protein, partial [Mycobacterium tuberculosis]